MGEENGDDHGDEDRDGTTQPGISDVLALCNFKLQVWSKMIAAHRLLLFVGHITNWRLQFCWRQLDENTRGMWKKLIPFSELKSCGGQVSRWRWR